MKRIVNTVVLISWLILSTSAGAECLEPGTCAPDVCCTLTGDKCWSNDPLLLSAIALSPILVFLVFFFPIRISWMKKAVRKGEYSDEAGKKAITWGVIASILTLLAMQYGVHGTLFPEGKYLEEVPVAQITTDKETVAPPFETTTFSGVTSYVDNESEIECYRWELLEKPDGSSAYLPMSEGVEVKDFQPDLFGDYKLKLTVQNSYGIENSTEAIVKAVPKQKLWIEMFWSVAGDDMDLHLLRGGKTWKESQGKNDLDCSFQNCIGENKSKVDWGTPGVVEDNPNLDLDDTSKTGPENINIMNPNAEEYLIGVHEFRSSYDGPNEVTVRIYFDKQIVWTGVKSINAEKSFVPFAKIDTATGIVTAL